MTDMKFLFEPQSVAVIGASQDPSKTGYKVLENIILGGYHGQVYPVNPRGGEILGRPVLKSLDDSNAPVDLTCIVIPAPFVFNAVSQCAQRGVKIALVITSGFSEIGNITPPQNIISKASERNVPLLSVPSDTFQTAGQIEHIGPLLTKDDVDKISLWEDLINEHLKIEEIV